MSSPNCEVLIKSRLTTRLKHHVVGTKLRSRAAQEPRKSPPSFSFIFACVYILVCMRCSECLLFSMFSRSPSTAPEPRFIACLKNFSASEAIVLSCAIFAKISRKLNENFVHNLALGQSSTKTYRQDVEGNCFVVFG